MLHLARNGTHPRLAAAVLPAIFLTAMVVRLGIFRLEHKEIDEQIYLALVEQIDSGRGYTLQGHPLLEQPFIERRQYDKPLFHHPPGAIMFLWPFYRLLGPVGLALGELASFALFFWSLVALSRHLVDRFTLPVRMALGGAAGFTPIVAHVHTHYWLDGPRVALFTAAAALLTRAVNRRSMPTAVGAGLLLAWSALTKLNTVLTIPGLAAWMWSVSERGARRRALVLTGVACAVAMVVVLPWFVAQARANGEWFPSSSLVPTSELVRTNRFVWLVTVGRTPWCYVRLLPQVVWTLVPSLLVLGALWRRPAVRARAPALVFWIFVVVGSHVVLGFLGSSKLLRHVVLVTPATVLLFLLAVAEGTARLREADLRGNRRAAALVLSALLALGFALELAHGFQTILLYPDRAMIRDLRGRIR